MGRRLRLGRRTWIVLALTLSAATCVSPGHAQEVGPPVRNPQRTIRRETVHWLALRNLNVVIQQRDFSCGAAALATLLRYYWDEPLGEGEVLNAVEQRLTGAELTDRVLNGLSMADLRHAAVDLGFVSSVGRVTLSDLYEVRVPVVVAIRYRGYDHFVVLRGIVNGWVYLADPTRGNVRIPDYVFENQWIDQAILVVLRPNQTESSSNQLDIFRDEAELGWLNGHVVRRHPERVFAPWNRR